MEFRFRAFNKAEGKYYYNIQRNNNGMTFQDYLDMPEVYIVEQYIGNQDINGYYIYEGDRVRYGRMEYYVKFDAGRLGYILCPADDTLADKMTISMSNSKRYIIEGNIHKDKGEML